jgi:hypothetical protein
MTQITTDGYFDDELDRVVSWKELKEIEQRRRDAEQKQHEASIAKQKMRLKRIKIKGAIDDSDLVGIT